MKKLVFSFVFFFAAKLWAAACCGGSSAVPSVITSDDATQFSSSYFYNQVDTEVTAAGQWRKKPATEIDETLKLEAAKIFSDRWQTGIVIPAVQKSVDNAGQRQQSSGLGDVSGDLAYEYLPEWEYNWLPKGIAFLQLTAPTGKSIYQSDNISTPDTTGRGFWTLGLGNIWTKNFSAWDVLTVFEVHKSLQNKFSNSQGTSVVKPGWGGSYSIGGGWNSKSARIGAAITWNYEDPIRIENEISGSNTSSVQRFATATVNYSYLWSNTWASSISYADQAIFGDPVNTSLGKIVSLSLVRKWAR